MQIMERRANRRARWLICIYQWGVVMLCPMENSNLQIASRRPLPVNHQIASSSIALPLEIWRKGLLMRKQNRLPRFKERIIGLKSGSHMCRRFGSQMSKIISCMRNCKNIKLTKWRIWPNNGKWKRSEKTCHLWRKYKSIIRGKCLSKCVHIARK